MKHHCNKSLKILFSCGIEDLHADGFDGSVDELQIFRDVFLGHGSGSNSEGCQNFENEKSKLKDVSFCSKSDDSVMLSQEDLQNLTDNSGPGYPSEECALTMRNHNLEVKRMKLSVEKLSNTKPCFDKVVKSSTSSKEAASSLRRSAPIITCRLVESSGQGFTYSCYMLEGHAGDVADKNVSKCEFSNFGVSDQKSNVVNKAIESPVSQKSHAGKLVACSSESSKRSKPRWKDSSFVELDEDEIPVPTDSTCCLRRLLRYHIHHLFRAAGWLIGRRKRSASYKGHGEYVYKSPEGRPIREFYRAWNICGERLFADAKLVIQRCDDKQWTDSTQFRTDLLNTLTEIEEKLNSLEAATALAHWWHLLDPFAIAAFIDKTHGLLSERGVKPYVEHNADLPQKVMVTTAKRLRPRQ